MTESLHMNPRIERSAMRRHFRTTYLALAYCGEFLLYACFAAPFVVDQSAAILSLEMPKQAVLFGTVWPYFSLLHLLALLTGCALYLLGPRRAIISNRAFVVYSAVNVVSLAAIPFLTPIGHPLYWDFGLEFLRLSSLVVLAGTVLEAREFNPLLLIRAFLILLIIPLVMLIATNPTGFLADRQGRVNGPGLEVTSTGHVAALGLLLGVSLPMPRKYRVLLVGLAAVMLLLSGARIPFILAVIMVVVQLWRGTKSKAKRIAIIGSVAGFTALAILIAASSSIGGGRLGTLTGDSADIETEYAVGRGMAALTAFKMLAAHPLGYLDSDWSVQEELVRLGYPSHTHSHYFQSYCRFGPLMLLFWGALAWRTRKGSRLRSPYAACLWFVLFGSALDYYGFVTKAMLLVFMIAELNESYIRGTTVPQLRNELAAST